MVSARSLDRAINNSARSASARKQCPIVLSAIVPDQNLPEHSTGLVANVKTDEM
jgi:hypothetical protein